MGACPPSLLAAASPQDVHDYVKSIGDSYAGYAESLRANGIDGAFLLATAVVASPSVTTDSDDLEELLREINVKSAIHRKILKRHLEDNVKSSKVVPQAASPVSAGNTGDNDTGYVSTPYACPISYQDDAVSTPTGITSSPRFLLSELFKINGIHLDPDDIETAVSRILSVVRRDNSKTDVAYDYDVFISYRVAADAKVAEMLFLSLIAHGIKPFLDKRCLPRGFDWKSCFLTALYHSKHFIAIVSSVGLKVVRKQDVDHSMDNVLLEYETALAIRNDSGNSGFILPVFVGSISNEGILSKFRDFNPMMYPDSIGPVEYNATTASGVVVTSLPKNFKAKLQEMRRLGFSMDQYLNHHTLAELAMAFPIDYLRSIGCKGADLRHACGIDADTLLSSGYQFVDVYSLPELLAMGMRPEQLVRHAGFSGSDLKTVFSFEQLRASLSSLEFRQAYPLKELVAMGYTIEALVRECNYSPNELKAFFSLEQLMSSSLTPNEFNVKDTFTVLELTQLGVNPQQLVRDFKFTGTELISVIELCKLRTHFSVSELRTIFPDTDVVDWDVQERLFEASLDGNFAVFQELLPKADVDACERRAGGGRYKGATALYYASSKGHLELVRSLLVVKAAVNIADEAWGQTALMEASANGHEAIVSLLLATEGIDKEKVDKNGLTAMDWARRYGNKSVEKLLLQ